MLNIISKYILPCIYLLGLMQILQVGGVRLGCYLLSAFNFIFILSNWKLLKLDKTGIIKCSLLYVILVLVYQILTPPLSEIYNPYEPLFYHVFITTGISFWIMGYKDNKIMMDLTKKIIAGITIVALLYSFFIMLSYGGVASLSIGSEIGTFLYQTVPYLLLWMSSVLFILNKPLRISIILLFAIVMMLSTKRGPLVTMFVGLIISLLINGRINVKAILSLSLVAFIGYYIIDIYFDTFLSDWLGRWSERDDISNGREEIWDLILNDVSNQDALTIIFGNGYEASHKLTYRFLWNAIGAHNDFIDILYNFGILGLSLFVLLIVSYLKNIIIAIKVKFSHADMLAYLIACFLFGSLISSNMTRYATVYFGVFFYYMAGQIERNRNYIIVKTRK